MHAAGFVVGGVRPSSVLWLPRQNLWTLTNFNRTVRTGGHAPGGAALAYAAPEVVEACRTQQLTLAAAPAHDAWALGVTALELMCDAPAFDFIHGTPTQVSPFIHGTPTQVSPFIQNSGAVPGSPTRAALMAVASQVP